MGLSQRLAAFLITVALLPSADAVTARELSIGEAEALKAVLARYETALEADDRAGALELSPPFLLDRLATIAGRSVEEILASRRVRDATSARPSAVRDVTFDLEGVQDVGETEDGILYAKVPYRSEIRFLGERSVATSKLLALRENGTWYVARLVGREDGGLMRKAYPTLPSSVLYAEPIRPVE